MIDQSLIAKYHRVPQNMADDHITAKFYDLLELLTVNGFEVMYGYRYLNDPIIYFTLKGCPLFVFIRDGEQYIIDSQFLRDENKSPQIKNIVAGLGIVVK